MRIVAIGVGGVGMAHIVQAANGGHEIYAIVDRNPGVLWRARTEWLNVWSGNVEEADPQAATIYATDLSHVEVPASPFTYGGRRPNARMTRSDKVDLAIIATPPHTHFKIIKGIRNHTHKIICEKPSIFPEKTELVLKWPEVTMSTEWAFHSKMADVGTITHMRMAFAPAHTTRWGYELPMPHDFGPHFLSLLEANLQPYHGLVSDEQQAENRLVAYAGDEHVIMEMSREMPFGFWVNGDEWEWEDDLFLKQINLGYGQLSLEQSYRFEEEVGITCGYLL